MRFGHFPHLDAWHDEEHRPTAHAGCGASPGRGVVHVELPGTSRIELGGVPAGRQIVAPTAQGTGKGPTSPAERGDDRRVRVRYR